MLKLGHQKLAIDLITVFYEPNSNSKNSINVLLNYLVTACQMGQLDVAKMLIDNYLSPLTDWADWYYWQYVAVISAMEYGRNDVVEMLFNRIYAENKPENVSAIVNEIKSILTMDPFGEENPNIRFKDIIFKILSQIEYQKNKLLSDMLDSPAASDKMYFYVAVLNNDVKRANSYLQSWGESLPKEIFKENMVKVIEGYIQLHPDKYLETLSRIIELHHPKILEQLVEKNKKNMTESQFLTLLTCAIEANDDETAQYIYQCLKETVDHPRKT